MPVVRHDLGFDPPAPSCTSHDADTGLQCTQEEGHYPPHRVVVEWTDECHQPESSGGTDEMATQ